MNSFGTTPPTTRVFEGEAAPALAGLHVDLHVTVLAAAARLAHELPLDVRDLPENRLFVGDLGLADVRLDLELSLQPVDDDLEVELAHSGDDRLRRLSSFVNVRKLGSS